MRRDRWASRCTPAASAALASQLTAVLAAALAAGTAQAHGKCAVCAVHVGQHDEVSLGADALGRDAGLWRGRLN